MGHNQTRGSRLKGIKQQTGPHSNRIFTWAFKIFNRVLFVCDFWFFNDALFSGTFLDSEFPVPISFCADDCLSVFLVFNLDSLQVENHKKTALENHGVLLSNYIFSWIKLFCISACLTFMFSFLVSLQCGGRPNVHDLNNWQSNGGGAITGLAFLPLIR